MGVTGLWEIVKPCARPTKLETLNRKRLAVDASIWIYQFLKAVRDKEGNALRNSHVVGFFRRICKLLFYGIKPVFVFDGGAPALKRNVIRQRKQRREGRRDDAARTAGKLLAVQMQRAAEEEEQRRKDAMRHPAVEEEAVPDENLVYVDELQMTQQERQAQRKFRKKDAYHLPDLDMSMNEMGGPNDPRVMSLEDLQSYAKQFEAGEDINVYDFSKIDYDSPFFMSLPASDRYNILNAARLRSRLRMGHSKEHLDSMFPDRMAFSKFQIERVTERNELTQRLMNINGGDDMSFGMNGSNRVAGEKGREYVLVKNDGVEGGWALGVVSNEGTTEQDAIDLDKPEPAIKDESESDDEFEDVAIEGLNRLPKRQSKPEALPNNDLVKQRQAFYRSRKQGAKRKPKKRVVEDENSLFVADEPAHDEEDQEEANGDEELSGNGEQGEEDEELQRAIAMSLGKDAQQALPEPEQDRSEHEETREVYNQSAVEEMRPIPKGGGRAIANIVNKRAFQTAPESREVTSFGVPTLRDDDESEEETMDFRAALAESRQGKRKTTPPGPRFNNVQPHSPNKARKAEDEATKLAKKHGFSGPLPFESLNLGSSLLGKKKMEQNQEQAAGGFENPELAEKQQKKAEPLPPWFAGNLEDDMEKQKAIEAEDARRAREYNRQFKFDRPNEGTLRRMGTGEVIDLDADDEDARQDVGIIDLEADGDGDDLVNPVEKVQPKHVLDHSAEEEQALDKNLTENDVAPRLGDVADAIRAKPPTSRKEDHRVASPPGTTKKGPFDNEDSGAEDLPLAEQSSHEQVKSPKTSQPKKLSPVPKSPSVSHEEDEEMIEWSDSDDEAEKSAEQTRGPSVEQNDQPADEASNEPGDEETTAFEDVDMAVNGATAARAASQPPRSPSAEFEDVDMNAPLPPPPKLASPIRPTSPDAHTSGLVAQEHLPVEGEDDMYDDFSDPEDEEIMRQLALEAEEHIRFASELNNKPVEIAQRIQDYEKELKQLRNQQKNERRDADDVTQVMVQEVKALLRFFGLPYIDAPMEAEAQCAELVRLSVVDGIVTDDSDVFLFGGTRIYKNFFNQAKYVECYLISDMEKEFDLTREKLISVAHLLGSDYTEGLPGVGPVTALEIISEFPDLEAFKDWWTGVQMQTITKEDDKGNSFRRKFRRNATKLFLPPVFPDERVKSAYLEPDVDSDPSSCEWGVVDLEGLRYFLMETIGWSRERTDEILLPVIRDMNRRMDEGTQANITQFFDGGVGVGAAGKGPGGEAYAPRKRAEQGSKRMGGALKRMAEKAQLRRGETTEGEGTPAADAEADQDGAANYGGEAISTPAQQAKPKGRKRKQAPVQEDGRDAVESDEGSEFEAPKRKAKKGRGGAKSAGGRGRGKKAT